MKKLNFTIFTVCLAAMLFCADPALAQQRIFSDKKILIEELRQLTGMQNLVVKQEVSTSNIGDSLMPLVEKDKELTDDQRRELKKQAVEGNERIEKLIRDFMADTTISSQLFDEVFFQLYDKNFTETELREMVVFYRTPTGQKSAKFMSGFINQLSKTYGAAFGQKFREFVTSKLQEEVELLKQKIQEVKTAKLET